MIPRAVWMGVVLAGLGWSQFQFQAQAAPTQASKPPVSQSLTAPTAASPTTASPTLSCASQVVLENLVALIVKSNQLDPTLNFLVSQARPDLSAAAQAQTQVKKRAQAHEQGQTQAQTQAQERTIACTVHLQIVRSKPEEVLDELDIAYRMLFQKDGSMGLEFAPMRKASP